jgi:apolipoprotein N-acyltransferase
MEKEVIQQPEPDHRKMPLLWLLIWAAACGALRFLTYAPVGWSSLGWFTPTLIAMPALFMASGDSSPIWRHSWGRGLLFSWIGGVLFYWSSLFWLRHATWPGFLLLGLYLGLFPMGFYAGVRRFAMRFRPDSGVQARLLLALFGASLWVVTEWAQAHFLTGMPWNLLAVSQADSIALIQIAEWTGVYGVSWIITAVSLLLFFCIWRMIRERHVLGRRPQYEFHFAMLILVLDLALGVRCMTRWRSGSGYQEGPVVPIAVVQGAVPQEVKEKGLEDDVVRERYLRYSELAIASGAKLVVWPESAAPIPILNDPLLYTRLQGMAMPAEAGVLIGTLESVYNSERDKSDQYNSAYLLEPDGRMSQFYRKIHLVPFGEFIPFEEPLPWMAKMIPIPGSLQRGVEFIEMEMPLGDGTSLHFPVLICFEDILPHHVRRYVQPGAQLLVNITNDGWFKRTAAPWQHAANARLRCVENRLPMIRSANTGMSCYIDRTGRLVEYFSVDEMRRDIYGEGTAVWEVQTSSLDKESLTFYTRYGDLFAAACTLFVFLGILVGCYPFRRATNATRNFTESVPADSGSAREMDG